MRGMFRLSEKSKKAEIPLVTLPTEFYKDNVPSIILDTNQNSYTPIGIARNNMKYLNIIR